MAVVGGACTALLVLIVGPETEYDCIHEPDEVTYVPVSVFTEAGDTVVLVDGEVYTLDEVNDG